MKLETKKSAGKKAFASRSDGKDEKTDEELSNMFRDLKTKE